MTEWTLLKRLLDAVHQHSTMIGRLWLTVMVIFRLLVVAVATEDVYTDEQEMFVCNTLQPGCSTVCYDAFAPISQPRFWVFHIISVSTPSLCFIIYTWHNLSKVSSSNTHRPGEEKKAKTLGHGGEELRQDGGQAAYDQSCDSDSGSIYSHKHVGHSLADVVDGITAHNIQRLDPNTIKSFHPSLNEASEEGSHSPGGVLSKCYVVHVCLRAILEVAFLLGQWKLFGFQVPAHVLCTSSPCSQPVDCYVSRPTEKTIFLRFMFCVGIFCIVLNLLELNHLGWKKIRQISSSRERSPWGGYPALTRYETFPEDSLSFTTSTDFREDPAASSLPTLDLVVGHHPDWSCVLKDGRGNKNQRAKICQTNVGTPKQAKDCETETITVKSKKGQRSAEVWI